MELLNNEWNFINQITLKIHASEDREKMINDFFIFLQNLISFDAASFFLYDKGKSISPIGYNISQEELDSYINEWEAIDLFKPLRPLLCDFSHPAVRVNEYNFKHPDEVKYRKIWKLKDYRYSIFAGLGYKNTVLGSISLYRKGNHSEEFSDRDLQIMDLLKAHINIWLGKEERPERLGFSSSRPLYELKKFPKV